MELILTIVAILSGIAALFAICAVIAAAWRWWKQRGEPAPPAPSPFASSRPETEPSPTSPTAAASAAALRRSAVASEQLLKIERERLWDGDRPELQVALHQVGLQSTTREANWEIHVTNTGRGPAESMELTGMVWLDGQWRDCPASKPVAANLLPGGKDTVDFVLPPLRTTQPHRALFICHFTDIHRRPGNERVFHSVYENRGDPTCRSFRPGQELPQEYRQACKVCRASS